MRATFDRRSQRLLAALAIVLTAAALTLLLIWTAYGYRFAASPQSGVHLDINRVVSTIAHNETSTPAELAAWTPPLRVRIILWSLDHHLLPEAWLNGLLFIYAGTLRRPSFLLGRFSDTGWWYYYPLAMLVKTPLATLAAVFVAPIVLFIHRWRTSSWSILCLTLAPLLYFLMALATPAAAGVRHMLPVYPFLFILTGVAAAHAWRSSRLGRIAMVLLAIALTTETLSAFPDYIAFFNRAAGGERGGIRLLADSNLDWGQDLPLLAKWQRAHQDRKLYLCYFGTADPAHYGIAYTNLLGGYMLGPAPEAPTTPGVIAISATNLIGLYSTPQADVRRYYEQLREAKPFEVLGGTIYLYDWPLKARVARSR